MTAALSLPLAAQTSASAPAASQPCAGLSDTVLKKLVRRHDEANSAFMRGDMKRYLELIPIAEDFTLMQPFGGPFSRGFDTRPEHVEKIGRYFKNGAGTLEMVETYASGDLAVLVLIERQTGEVGGLPEQDWSLRVTLVYRRHAADWHLVHRHADPLVRHIGLERAAVLARG